MRKYSVLSMMVLWMTLFLVNCNRLERGKQIQTQARMQEIRQVIINYTNENDRLPDGGDLKTTIDNMEDAWGREILYQLDNIDDVSRYVIVSLGSDGKLDLQRIADYYDREPNDVGGMPEMDIVIVDGCFINNAGK